jgi:hypothetical protein
MVSGEDADRIYNVMQSLEQCETSEYVLNFGVERSRLWSWSLPSTPLQHGPPSNLWVNIHCREASVQA